MKSYQHYVLFAVNILTFTPKTVGLRVLVPWRSTICAKISTLFVLGICLFVNKGIVIFCCFYYSRSHSVLRLSLQQEISQLSVLPVLQSFYRSNQSSSHMQILLLLLSHNEIAGFWARMDVTYS